MAKQQIKKSELLEIIREQVRAFLKSNPRILEAYGVTPGKIASKDHKKLGTKDSGSNAPSDAKWYMKNKPSKKEVKVSTGSKKASIDNAPEGAKESKPAVKKFSFTGSKGKK